MTERRMTSDEYKDHEILVFAERSDDSSSWTIEINIKTLDGSFLPPIKDSDHSFDNLEIAFATGNEIGRNLIDSN